MPELPEVETVRRGLEPVLLGRRIERVEQRRADLRFPFPDRFTERLEGCRVISVGRRSKYLLLGLDSGETLIVHLGMSGRITVSPSPRSSRGEGRGIASGYVLIGSFVHETGGDARHDHAVFHVEGGARVTYNDPRRFGFMLLTETCALASHPLMASLGPEPLGNAFNASYLAARARGRKSDVKSFLLDQRTVAGLGNIYVCEVLFRAGVKPARPASCLATAKGTPSRRCEDVVAEVRRVLDEAIAAGGSSLRDYRQADGTRGGFQASHLVYGREGEPCARPGCRGMVRRTIQGGRSTFHCASCQR